MAVADDRLLSKKEVAHYLGVSERTVDNLRSRGQLVGHMVGNLWKCRLSELERYLRDHPGSRKKPSS